MAKCVGIIRRLVRGLQLSGKMYAQSASIPFLVLAACQSEDNTFNPNMKRKPIKFFSAGEMSHEALIQQACSLTTNSSSQLITQVLIAITDTSKEYRNAMSKLMLLLDNSITTLSNSPLHSQDEIEDLIVAQRNSVDDYRKAVMELISLMEYVEKMVTSAAETAYLAGAEQSSTLMCERLNSALDKVGLECANNREAEEELLKLQQTYVIQLSEANGYKTEEDDHQLKGVEEVQEPKNG